MASTLKLENIGILHPDFNSVSLDNRDILAPIQKFVIAELETVGSRFIASADDTLFDMAERSCNNGEQTQLFESLRHLRKCKQLFLDDFKQALLEEAEPQQKESKPSNVISFEDALENMSLVSDEDMERELAIANILVRVMQSSEVTLNYLNLRYAELNKHNRGKKVSFEYMPEAICNAFNLAIKCFEFDIKRQIILFKAFERELVMVLPLVYEQLNIYLRQKGILPEVSAQMMARFLQKGSVGPTTSQQKKSREQASQSKNFLEEESTNEHYWLDDDQVSLENTLFDRQLTDPSLFSTTSQSHLNPDGSRKRIGSLDHQQVTQQRRGQNFSGYQTAQLSEYAEQVQMMSRLLDRSKPQAEPRNSQISQQEMIAILTEIQQQQANRPIGGNVIDIRQLLQQKHQGVGEISRKSIGKVNDDLIDIVSMMFDFIVSNDQLNAEIKVELARLQIPMLKVAIADKQLFKNANHPARGLLNNMAQQALAIGLKPRPEDQPVIKKIKSCVNQVIENFDQNVEEFEYLLKEFNEFVANEKRRSEIIIQRTRQAEEGKAKLERANQVTERAFERMLAHLEVDDEILDILQEGFRPVAAFYLLKHGKSGGAFKKLLKNIQRLIISVNQKHQKSIKSEHLMALNKVLKDYLQEIHPDQSRVKHWLQQIHKLQHAARIAVEEHIEQTHLQSLAEMGDEKVAEDVQEDGFELSESGELCGTAKKFVKAEDDDFANAVDCEQEQVAQDGGAIRLEDTFIDYTKAKKQTDQSNDGAPAENVSNQTAKADKGDASTHPKLPSKHEKVAKELAIGSWVEVLQKDGWTRAKLIARLKSSDKMLFVNRIGVKVCEFTSATFTQAMDEKHVQIIDDGAVFEKALQAVVVNLKQMKGPKFD